MIVGLGNPGDEYEQTRHNAGFQVVDLLAETLGMEVRQKKFGARFGSVGRRVLGRLVQMGRLAKLTTILRWEATVYESLGPRKARCFPICAGSGNRAFQPSVGH